MEKQLAQIQLSQLLVAIALKATVPGLEQWGFFKPLVAGALFRAALVASCFLGTLPPVNSRKIFAWYACDIDICGQRAYL